MKIYMVKVENYDNFSDETREFIEGYFSTLDKAIECLCNVGGRSYRREIINKDKTYRKIIYSGGEVSWIKIHEIDVV